MLVKEVKDESQWHEDMILMRIFQHLISQDDIPTHQTIAWSDGMGT
jgi:hypothetical protein